MRNAEQATHAEELAVTIPVVVASGGLAVRESVAHSPEHPAGGSSGARFRIPRSALRSFGRVCLRAALVNTRQEDRRRPAGLHENQMNLNLERGGPPPHRR